MVATSHEQTTTFQSASESNTANRVAVLLMGYGEVENYADFANYNEQALHLLTAKFAPVPHWMYPAIAKLLAAFDLHEWHHQHNHFISPHNAIFERQRAGIEAHLQARWGEQVKVFKAFNFCAPFLPHQVISEIQAQGFTKLLIYPLLVVDSIFTSGIAIEQVNQALNSLANDTSKDATETNSLHWLHATRYIPSFYQQPEYLDLLAQLVEHKIQTELAAAHLPSQTGIILMNHGCPHKAKGFTSGIDESERLYEAVRERLIYKYPLISVGWLNHDTPMIEWTEPNVTQAAKNLIQLGATALVLMPIGFATENHETLLDVDHIIHHLQHKHPHVNYVQMPCVNDHEDFLQMAAGWAEPHVAQLLTETGTEVNRSLKVMASNSHHDHAHHDHADHDHAHHDHAHHDHAHHDHAHHDHAHHG
jgi:protoporphyrin/coproporphyrin ferrochelatase